MATTHMRLSDDQLRAFIGNDYHLGEFQNEQRKAGRFPMRQRAGLALIKDCTVGQKALCQIKDISTTGVGLLVGATMKSGTEFVLWLKDREQNTVAIECKVMRCGHGGNGSPLFTVGALFVRMHTPMSPQERRKQMEVEQIRAAILG